MKTKSITITLSFEYQDAEPEVGIPEGWSLYEITDDEGNDVWLQPSVIEKINEYFTHQ